MMHSSFFPPYHQSTKATRASTRSAQGASDYLRAHDKMASLLPAVARMIALQKDCAAILPEMFNACAVLQFDSDQLTLSIPNAALAAKLKQKLPKLQDALLQRGWQVSAIRLKVQVGNITEKHGAPKSLQLPTQAVSALATLNNALEESPRNAALRAAIDTMIRRHGATK
ncbi:MAG: hypothetical protein A3I66_19675 [Burkholderiales bacterium RIFCSPLOWO2_02_FULL_57_36]|nr:MAG: hypothetical protein A3I66_19675 [Burkholderiales bacterium RIFCSPLOWO2_02_FULL_57_36]